MAKKYDNPGAVAAGTVLTAGTNHLNASLIMGCAQADAAVVSSNGTFQVSAAGTMLTGSSFGVAGTSYVEETVPATTSFSFSIFWEMPSGGITVGAGPFWAGAGTTRAVAMSVLTTEQIRFFSSTGGTLFTSTVSGGFTAAVRYRTDFHCTVATSTTGRLVTETYLEAGTSPISGTVYDSGATINLGTAGVTKIRRGIRTGTGTADDNVLVNLGMDLASAYLMGPRTTGLDVNLSDGVGITDTSLEQVIDYIVTISDGVGLADSQLINFVVAAATGPKGSLNDLEYAYLGALGRTGSLADRRKQEYTPNEFVYFATRSGLTPASAWSLADHKMRYFSSLTGFTGTITDLRRIAYGG